MTIKPQESDYTSHVAYTRTLEHYCAEIEADLRAASMSAAWQGFEINELRAELERLKAQAPLSGDVVRRLLGDAGYEDDIQGRADFINGLRHGELEHGITGPTMRKKVE